jgi:hypothetical protein
VDGNFVFITANFQKVRALVDTGASRSCISSSLVQKLKLKYNPIKTGDARVLFSVDNSAIKTEGTVDIDLKIQGLVIPFEFTVMRNVTCGLIIGLDLLNACQAKIDLEDKTVTFCDLVALPLETTRQQNFLKLTNALVLPPRSESLIPVTIPRNYVLKTSIVEPVPSLKKKSLLLAKTLILPDRHVTACSVLNLTNQAKFIRKGTVIATISGATPEVESKLSKDPERENDRNDQTILEKIEILNQKGVEITNPELSEEEKHKFYELLYDNRDLLVKDNSE